MKFLKSAEFNASAAAGGALVGVYTSPYFNTALAKYGAQAVALGDLALGAVSFAVGVYVKNDVAASFAIGFGVSYIVEGVLRFIMPGLTSPYNAVAVASTQSSARGSSQVSPSWY